jgi:hypothetical protein
LCIIFLAIIGFLVIGILEYLNWENIDKLVDAHQQEMQTLHDKFNNVLKLQELRHSFAQQQLQAKLNQIHQYEKQTSNQEIESVLVASHRVKKQQLENELKKEKKLMDLMIKPEEVQSLIRKELKHSIDQNKNQF